MFGIEGGAWVGFLVGAVFIAAGLFLAIRTVRINGKCTVPAVARVVRIDEEWSSSADGAGSWSYFPVFQFTTESGRVIEARAAIGRGKSPYRIGQSVELRYDPDKPEQIAVKKDIIVMFVFGLVFAAIGAGVLILMKVQGYW